MEFFNTSDLTLNSINIVLITVGLAYMIWATIRYHKLVALIHSEKYATLWVNRAQELILFFMLYFFIFGFIVGLYIVTTRNVEPIYTFIVAVFLLGALFATFSIENQILMADLLRNKNVELINTFVNAVDMKDTYTKGHSEHVYEITKLFYDALIDGYKKKISRTKLLDAARLHDCGKISIKDDILNKPGELSEDDWEIIRTHTSNGKRILDDTYLCEISDWVLYHHERIDGEGYYGLSGNDIPLESRIIAIADTYSALATDRIYRSGIRHDEVIDIMLEVSGTQLDEKLMEQFITIDAWRLESLLQSQ